MTPGDKELTPSGANCSQSGVLHLVCRFLPPSGDSMLGAVSFVWQTAKALVENTSADYDNPFQSPPTPVGPEPASASAAPFPRFGDILGRAFNSYFQKWSSWPVPLLVCGLIALASFVCCFFPILLAQGPLICALYWCAFCNLRGWPVDTVALGRSWELFWPAMTSNIVLLLVEAIPGLLLQIAALAVLAFSGVLANRPGGQPNPADVFAFFFSTMIVFTPLSLVLVMATFWFRTRTMFVMPLVADRGYGFSTAFQASWQATRHRFWERLLLIVLASIIGMLGAYLCYVGLLFTLPLQFLIIAAAYEDEFGIEGLPAPPQFPGAGGTPFQTGGGAIEPSSASGGTAVSLI